MPKQSLNLSVERESLERGQRYSQQHGVSISNLVDDFLAHLPVEGESADSLPADVRDLIGIGAGEADRESYRRHLRKKYAK
jgi:hypothetical protein